MGIRIFIVSFILDSGSAIRQQVSQQTMQTTNLQPYNDSRLPFLPNIDYTRLYCFDSSSASSFLARPIPPATSLVETKQGTVTSCKSDADCNSASGTPFCLAGLCRECRYSSDCPAPTTFQWAQNFCSLDTSYACSECAKDSDCGESSGKICRTVFSPYGQDRKRCVGCDPEAVPEDGVLKTQSSCDWYCQSATDMIGPDGKCEPCPTCTDGQMLVPTEDFALSQPRNFFPACPMSNNPRCIDCPAKDNPCAIILSPTSNWVGVPGVGKLPSAYACGTFKCKADWWLDSTINQCRKCDYRSCPAGQRLVGCGVASAGTCQPCPYALPVGVSYISPRDLTYTVTVPDDVCKPSCNANQTLVRANASSPWMCQMCATNEVCSPGYFFSGCGGQNPGQCLQCAPAPMAGTYWSGPGCGVTPCNPADCQAGHRLVGCGGSSAGECQACPAPLPLNAGGFRTIFDEQTLTQDTCGASCLDGFFLRRVSNSSSSLNTSVSAYECAACDASVCPLGQKLLGCGGDKPGRCGGCPSTNPGIYLIANSSTCETAPCPTSASACPAGQFWAGCGGASPGACVSCGTLPTGAANWLPSRKCDIQCSDGYFLNVTLNGLVKTCVPCADIQRKTCPVGQTLDGCGPTSTGTCESCPSINSTTYWTGNNCDTGSCTARGCASDAIAVGCGLDNPGTCTPCASVNTLPPFASGWTAVDNRCLVVCMPGYYRSPANTCEQCSLGRCADGMVLANCGGTEMGACTNCTARSDGLCYVGFGVTLGDPTSCPTGPCPVFI
jgi:hypothetical protein